MTWATFPVACCKLPLDTCCWQSQPRERFVADRNYFPMAKRSQQNFKRKGREGKEVGEACTHSWHTCTISRLSNFTVEMALNAVTAHRSWQHLRIASELQSTWRRKSSFNSSLKSKTDRDSKIERERWRLAVSVRTHLAHQRGIMQLIQCGPIGSLYGHHIAIIIEPWQCLTGEMPAENTTAMITHIYTHKPSRN